VTETADTSSNWRRKEKEQEQGKDKEVEEVSPERDDQRESQEKSIRFRKQLDDDYSDEEPSSIPFIKLKDIDGTSKTESRRWTKKKRAMEDREERAYRLVSRFDDPKIVEHMIEKVSNTELEGVTIGKMIALSPEFARSMRSILTKTRAPIKQSLVSDVEGTSSAFPFMEDIYCLDRDAININELPRVDSLYIATKEDTGTIPGSIICQDPVLQYLATLSDNEQPRQLYAGVMSAPLRTLRPRCAGKEWIESVIDGGSQIVSMALSTAERLSLTWNPNIRIVMQSANGQLKSSAGLARNIPFEFDEITVYLQVHIIDQNAYEVLLGRPFEILTELQISNWRDGSQTITLTDPNSTKKCTMPTYVRGTFAIKEHSKALTSTPKKLLTRQANREATIEEVPDKGDRDYIEEDKDDSDEEETFDSEEEDFRGSSRN
jgi:hypothetical protein